MMQMETGLAETLDSLGFTRGRIAEAILVTVNPGGTYNAAPMGAKRVGDTRLEVKPYKTSATYRNLLRDSRSTLNVTSDPMMFLATAFKEEIGTQPRLEGMRLVGCDAYLTLEKMGGRDLGEWFSFENDVKDVTVSNASPRAFSRGVAEAITATIHATRVKAFTEQGRLEEAGQLQGKVCECIHVIRRVSPEGSPEAEAAEKLERLLARWRATG
ncbi:DUF447 family protein [Candidatus Bathyarchaeota archaeon]|nr:DUF447 family protein [Candidatus Bathyarchaeota archaeon]